MTNLITALMGILDILAGILILLIAFDKIFFIIIASLIILKGGISFF